MLLDYRLHLFFPQIVVGLSSGQDIKMFMEDGPVAVLGFCGMYSRAKQNSSVFARAITPSELLAVVLWF